MHSNRRSLLAAAALALLAMLPRAARAQGPIAAVGVGAHEPPPARSATSSAAPSGRSAGAASWDTTKTFFVKRDLAYAGIAIGASAVVSIWDQKINDWIQTSVVGTDSTGYSTVHNLTRINEQPLTIAALLTYGIGRLVHSPTTADIGAHWSEAMLLTVGVSELIRSPLGRARPHESPDDPFKFELGAGFTKFQNRSYPSIHAAAGFATAAVMVSEIRDRKPKALVWAAPLLYAGALVPGITRMYLDQHWASDVVAGAFLGQLLGERVVHYAHTHHRSKIDRALLGTALVPDGYGRMLLVVTLGGGEE